VPTDKDRGNNLELCKIMIQNEILCTLDLLRRALTYAAPL